MYKIVFVYEFRFQEGKQFDIYLPLKQSVITVSPEHNETAVTSKNVLV